jgi:hypothetical protein
MRTTPIAEIMRTAGLRAPNPACPWPGTQGVAPSANHSDQSPAHRPNSKATLNLLRCSRLPPPLPPPSPTDIPTPRRRPLLNSEPQVPGGQHGVGRADREHRELHRDDEGAAALAWLAMGAREVFMSRAYRTVDEGGGGG